MMIKSMCFKYIELFLKLEWWRIELFKLNRLIVVIDEFKVDLVVLFLIRFKLVKYNFKWWV